MRGALASKLMRMGSIAIIIRFVSAGLGFGLVFVLSQWMVSDEFGRYGFAFSLATTAALVTDLGQKRLILRSLATYVERGRADLMRAVLRHSLTVTAFGILLTVSVVCFGAVVSDFEFSLFATILLAIAMLIAEFQANLLRGLGSLLGSVMPREVIWRPVAVAAMAIVGGGVSIVVSADAAIWALALALVAMNIVQLVLFTLPRWRKAISEVSANQMSLPDDSKTLAAEKSAWWPSSLRLWAVSAMNTGMLPLSVVIVGLFVSAAETGAFFAAVRIAALIAFPLQGLNLVTSPMLASANAANDPERLQYVASFTALWSTLAALAGALFLLIFGPSMLASLNPEFATSATALIIVMAGFIISSMCGSSSQLMNMTGHDKEFLRILLISNPVGLISLVLLSYLYGGFGAAVGLFLLKAIWNIVVVLWARRHLRVDPSILAFVAPPKGISA